MGHDEREGAVELSEQERAGCETYLQAYGVLIGDQRTGETFRGVVEGIIASKSLLAARIARFSPSASGSQACRTAGAQDGA